MGFTVGKYFSRTLRATINNSSTANLVSITELATYNQLYTLVLNLVQKGLTMTMLYCEK